MSAEQPVTTVVETLEEVTEEDTACVGDILSEFGSASFPSILLAVSILLVSPLSGVPLFSSVVGITIFLIASQAMFGRTQIWIPKRLKDWKLNTERSEVIIRYAHKLAAWLDRGTDARWAPLVSPPASRVLYGICAICGLCLPFLEIIPFSSSLIGVAVSLIATGLLARDGLIAVLALPVLSIAAMIPLAAYATLLS